MLNIPESTARKRLALAQKDIEAAAAKLTRSDEEAGKKRASTFLLPFGVGAWLKLRDLQNPPQGTDDRIWKRLQSTMKEIERDNDRPASTPPQQPPPRARPRGLSRLARSLKNPWSNLVSACLGGAIVALLFLLRPTAPIAILRIPVPLVLVTGSSTVLADVPPPSTTGAASSLPPELPTAEAHLPGDATFAAEMVFLRRARTAYATGDVRATLAALDDYAAHYPAGQFKPSVDALRASLPDAGAR